LGGASGESGAGAGAAAAHRNGAGGATGGEEAAAGAAAGRRNSSGATGAEGAAAGAAAGRRNQTGATGGEDAAAGAAAARRNQPQASGAEGAAAGAAVANRNAPAASGAEGAAAGAAIANRNAPAASGFAGAAGGYAAVRSNFNHPNMYGQAWYGEHHSAWAARGWAVGAAWTAPTIEALAVHCGYDSSTAISYNYGGNVTCLDGNVVINGQPAGTAEEFSQQASDLAASGTVDEDPATDEWLPLGVFALVRNENQHPQLIMQLAVNQQGLIRGNYTDEVTDNTLPVRGAVDETTQRAAWTVGDNAYSVMEAGLSNLVAGEAPALIHKSGQTQRWLLVRLDKPNAGADEASGVEAPR
jgi:hypothetical protein